ncbi:MAG: hypothetical protein LBD24_00040 [Spirochaetaceae bacterium]|nr:hypothetical protein [Spirochaetaceae bacterium]
MSNVFPYSIMPYRLRRSLRLFHKRPAKRPEPRQAPLLRTTTRRFQTAHRCAERSRALTAAGPLTGHGVAPFRNNSAETAGGCGRRLRVRVR